MVPLGNFLLGCLAALPWRIARRRHPCADGHDWTGQEDHATPDGPVSVRSCRRCPAWQAEDPLGAVRADVIRWTRHL